MTRKLTALAALAAAAITLTAVAAAGPVSAKQRVAIDVKGAAFVLTPLTSGAIQRDSGTATFCCWSQLHVVRGGQVLDLNNPQMTLTGKRGTLVSRNRIVWMDIPDGSAVFTGTWKVVRATGDYAGLVGGGLTAGLSLANGNTKERLTGALSSK